MSVLQQRPLYTKTTTIDRRKCGRNTPGFFRRGTPMTHLDRGGRNGGSSNIYLSPSSCKVFNILICLSNQGLENCRLYGYMLEGVLLRILVVHQTFWMIFSYCGIRLVRDWRLFVWPHFVSLLSLLEILFLNIQSAYISSSF